MDEKSKATRTIEDLPLQAEQAGEVESGQCPDAPERIGSVHLSPGVIEGFNPRPDSPKT